MITNTRQLLNSPSQLALQRLLGGPIGPKTAAQVDKNPSMVMGSFNPLHSVRINFTSSEKQGATLQTYFVEKPTNVYLELMRNSEQENAIFIGDCAPNSFLVDSLMSQIRGFNINTGELSIKERDEAATVYVLVNQDAIREAGAMPFLVSLLNDGTEAQKQKTATLLGYLDHSL